MLRENLGLKVLSVIVSLGLWCYVTYPYTKPPEPQVFELSYENLPPNFTIAKFCRETASGNPLYLAQRERVCEGMRLAGIPQDIAALP